MLNLTPGGGGGASITGLRAYCTCYCNVESGGCGWLWIPETEPTQTTPDGSCSAPIEKPEVRCLFGSVVGSEIVLRLEFIAESAKGLRSMAPFTKQPPVSNNKSTEFAAHRCTLHRVLSDGSGPMQGARSLLGLSVLRLYDFACLWSVSQPFPPSMLPA